MIVFIFNNARFLLYHELQIKSSNFFLSFDVQLEMINYGQSCVMSGMFDVTLNIVVRGAIQTQTCHGKRRLDVWGEGVQIMDVYSWQV